MGEIERLTHKAEQNENISSELNGISDIQERLRIARSMRDLNKEDRKQDPNLPEMDLTIAKDGPKGNEVIMDIDMKPVVEFTRPGSWTNMFSDSTNVYSMPKEEMTHAEWVDAFKQGLGADKRK